MRHRLSEPPDLFLSPVAVVLFLAGAGMLLTGIGSVIPFALIAIGAVLTIISLNARHGRGGTAH